MISPVRKLRKRPSAEIGSNCKQHHPSCSMVSLDLSPRPPEALANQELVTWWGSKTTKSTKSVDSGHMRHSLTRRKSLLEVQRIGAESEWVRGFLLTVASLESPDPSGHSNFDSVGST
jgi:hypothetical protein